MYNRLQLFGKGTSIQGLRYVADDNRHPLIRLFWLLVFVASLVIMMSVFHESYLNYQDNSISFVAETTYLDWNTTFPAVTICEITSSEIFWTPAPDEDYSPVQQFMSDIIFFTGSCYSCATPCDTCEKFDFKEITKKYRRSCRGMMKGCKWNDVQFDCCEKFLPLKTEYGTCFSINSLHTRVSGRGSDVTLKSNRKSGPGQLYIQTLDDVRMYFHAPEDVPFINCNSDQRKDVSIGELYNVTINIVEIENDAEIHELPVEKKGCRFPLETTDELVVHKYYSYSTCIVQCHADAQKELCNCTHHLMPVLGEKEFCDINGLQCLTDNFETLNRLHAKGSTKPGLICECLPSCVEPEYKIVLEQRGVTAGHSEIYVKLQSLPIYRFKRSVVRSTMDLVVSIGGAAGLFIGASLLSIMEIPYLLFLRR